MKSISRIGFYKDHSSSRVENVSNGKKTQRPEEYEVVPVKYEVLCAWQLGYEYQRQRK